MDIYEAVIIGIIQGLAEWLPISSEGMISLVMVKFFGKTLAEALPLAIWLHTGTMLSAVVYFWKDIKKIVTEFFTVKRSKWSNIGTFIIISTIFSVIVAAPIYFFIKSFDASFAMLVIGLMLLITGVIQKVSKAGTIEKLKIKHSVLLGIIQGLAVIPGISRSGSTVSVLLFLKYKAQKALEVSFLMSIPLIFVAVIGMMVFDPLIISIEAIVALVISFAVGLLSIRVLMDLARRLDFSYICFILGILSILAFFL